MMRFHCVVMCLTTVLWVLPCAAEDSKADDESGEETSQDVSTDKGPADPSAPPVGTIKTSSKPGQASRSKQKSQKEAKTSGTDDSQGVAEGGDAPLGGPDEAKTPLGGMGEEDAPLGGPDEADTPLGGPGNEDAPLGGPDEAETPLGGPGEEDAPLGGPSTTEGKSLPPIGGAPPVRERPVERQIPLSSPAQGDQEAVPMAESQTEPPVVNENESRRRNVLTLDVVTITGDASEIARVTGSAHRVDQDTLEQQQYDDVHRVLKQVPGVYVRDEDGFGLRPNIGLRGANSDRSAKITLMEDGVLLAPAPYSAPAAYYFPLTTRLTGVEVFKGPSSIQYGPNTIGGAMNMITRSVPADGHVGSIDIGGGNYGSRKAHAYYGWGGRDFGLLFEGVQIGSDGFKELDNGGGTGFSKSEFMVKLRANNSLAADVHHRLELKLGYSLEQSDETYLGLTDADFEATPYRRYAASQLGDMEWWRSQAKLVYNVLFGDETDLRVTLYRHDFSRQWTKLNDFGALAGVSVAEVVADPDNLRHAPYYALLQGTNEWTGSDNERLAIGTNDRSYVSEGAEVHLQWELDRGWFGNILKVGSRFHTDRIERDHTQREYDMFSGVVVPMTETDTTKENEGSATAISAFVFDEIRLGSSLRLTPGLRFEHIETRLEDKLALRTIENTSDIVLPGFGVWWSLNDHWGLLGGVHQGFSPLAPGQSDDAEPEKSTNYEVGTRFNYRRLHGELIGFWNDYDNLVGTCTQSAGCSSNNLDDQYNAGQATVYGLESVIGAKFPVAGGLIGKVDVSYTYTLGQFDTEFDSGFSQWGAVDEGDELPYVPVHTGNVKLAVEHMKAGGVLSVSYVSDMRDSAGQGSIEDRDLIPAHTVLDLSMYVLPSADGRVYLGIDNVLDTVYMVSRRPYGARPGKRRQVNLGYQHTF